MVLCLLTLMFISHLIACTGAASASRGYSCSDPDAEIGMSHAEEPVSGYTPGAASGPLPEKCCGTGGTGLLSHLSRIYVKRINLVGNTVFSEGECTALTARYENREITAEELQDLREAFTRFYRQRGYVTSWVIIPDQEVRDGVIHLQAVEGRITGIEVEGNTRFRTGYLAARLRRSSGPPVNVAGLQGVLERLDDDPRIRRINALLGPGPRPGEGILTVRIDEEPPYVLDFGACNCRPRVFCLQARN